MTARERVEVVQEPLSPPGPGELLIRTRRTLISTGTELIVLMQNFSPGTHWAWYGRLPFRPGYSNAGVVEAVGEGVEGWQAGDRVASHAPHASHVLVRTERAVNIPNGVSDDAAAWIELGKITQVGVRSAEHVLGDVVVVVGLGPLGQLVVQYAAMSGAAELIAIDLHPMRLELAERFGATRVLQMPAAEAREAVQQLSDGRGADVVYDVTGHPQVFAAAQQLLRKRGTLILLGDAGRPELQHLTPAVIRNALRIIGAHAALPPDAAGPAVRWSGRQMRELFMHYLAQQRLHVEELITHRFRAAQAAEAYAMLVRERERTMGVVLDWEA